MGKAQVHAFRVLQVEGTLVELGDGVVGVQQRRLLVHFPDDLQGGRETQMERENQEIGQMEEKTRDFIGNKEFIGNKAREEKPIMIN